MLQCTAGGNPNISLVFIPIGCTGTIKPHSRVEDGELQLLAAARDSDLVIYE